MAMTKEKYFQDILDHMDERKDLHSNKGEVLLVLCARVYDLLKASNNSWKLVFRTMGIEISMINEMYRSLPSLER